MPVDELVSALTQTVNLEQVAPSQEWAAYFNASTAVCPRDVDALRETLRLASGHQVPLYLVGGGTSLGWGLPGTDPGVAVVLNELNGIVDYPARDMTITVRAGTSIAALQETLAKEGQWLPVDVPLAERATIGGAIAANVSGPRRFGYGTLRDYVIGIAVVTTDGKLARAGGRVVKNVAGYDLCKLYAGSFGSLAAIAEVTLKVRPQPEKTELVAVGCRDAADVEKVLAGSLSSRTRPVIVELLNRHALEKLERFPAKGDHPWGIIVGFEGFEEAVAWQVETFLDEVRRWTERRCAAEAVHKDDAASVLGELGRYQITQTGVVAKLNYLPSRTPGLLEELSRARVPWMLAAHANNGIAWLVSEGLDEENAILEDLRKLRRWAVEAEGNLVVKSPQFCLRHQYPPWGAERSDTWLMRRLKERFDPGNTLNRGRFLDHPGAVESLAVLSGPVSQQA